MKAAIVAAVAMTFVAVVHTGEAISCPPVNEELVTLLPNPNDCKTFYACNNGIPYLMYCMSGLEFNPIEKVCDWPEHAKCSLHASSTTSPNTPTETQPSQPSTSTEPETASPTESEPTQPPRWSTTRRGWWWGWGWGK